MKKVTIILLFLLALKNAKAAPEIDVFGFHDEHITMEVADLAVYFKNGRLIAKDSHHKYGEVRRLLPFVAGSRNFITVGETIYVAENGEIINQIQMRDVDFGIEPRVEVFPKWVNFRHRRGYFLSYSIVQNRFFRLDPSRTYDEGVIINSVRWATRNVDRPGTFAASPESAGRRFQWGRRQALVDTAGHSGPEDAALRSDTTWTRANDPCPQGWRVPTENELRTLLNAGIQPTDKNGVRGRLFGTAPNQIFLPASTRSYWSSTQGDATGIAERMFKSKSDFAMSLSVSATSMSNSPTWGRMNIAPRRRGYSVRCVAE